LRLPSFFRHFACHATRLTPIPRDAAIDAMLIFHFAIIDATPMPPISLALFTPLFVSPRSGAMPRTRCRCHCCHATPRR
jgi:hypothetical protein